MLDDVHAVGKAARARELDLILGLILAVTSAALGLPENGRGQRALSGQLGHIVHDAVFVEELLRLKFSAHLVAEAERDARVDDRLSAQHVGKIRRGDIDISKHVEIGQPARERAGPLAAVSRLDLQLLALFAGDLPALKVEGIFVPVAPDGHIHIARGVLRGTSAEAVEAEGIFVVVAIEIVVLAAGVELAVHKLPVVALFLGVPVHGTAAPVVLHLDAAVGVMRERDDLAVPLARLVDGVREDLEHRVLAAVQSVRAKDNARALAHALRTLE